MHHSFSVGDVLSGGVDDGDVVIDKFPVRPSANERGDVSRDEASPIAIVVVEPFALSGIVFHDVTDFGWSGVGWIESGAEAGALFGGGFCPL